MDEGWYVPAGHGEDGFWKSEDHKVLLDLCDCFCYADMTPEQKEAHKAKIKVLSDRIGYVG